MLRSVSGISCSGTAAVLAMMGMTQNLSAKSQTLYSIEVQDVHQQTGASTIVGGYSALGYNEYSIVAKVETGGASLSSAPVVVLSGTSADYPTGKIVFSTGTNGSPNWPNGSGVNRYQYGNAWTTLEEMTAAVGTGTFTFVLGDATATPSLNLNTTNPNLPVTPKLTGGGTWSGSTLLVDATTSTTLTFNTSDFTGYTSGLGGVISFNLYTTAGYPVCTVQLQSQYVPSLGKTDEALTSFTISTGVLEAGVDYILQVNYTQVEDINTTSFTGTGISGSTVGVSYYTSTTFINIHAVPEPGTLGLLGTGAALLAGAAVSKARRRNRA